MMQREWDREYTSSDERHYNPIHMTPFLHAPLLRRSKHPSRHPLQTGCSSIV